MTVLLEGDVEYEATMTKLGDEITLDGDGVDEVHIYYDDGENVHIDVTAEEEEWSRV